MLCKSWESHADTGKNAQFSGAVLISPGYDMELSLRHMTGIADLIITRHAKQHFLQANHDTLKEDDHTQGALNKLYRSRSMQVILKSTSCRFYENLSLIP